RELQIVAADGHLGAGDATDDETEADGRLLLRLLLDVVESRAVVVQHPDAHSTLAKASHSLNRVGVRQDIADDLKPGRAPNLHGAHLLLESRLAVNRESGAETGDDVAGVRSRSR